MEYFENKYGKPLPMSTALLQIGRAAMYDKRFKDAIKYFDLTRQEIASDINEGSSILLSELQYFKGQCLATFSDQREKAIFTFLEGTLENPASTALQLRAAMKYLNNYNARSVLKWCKKRSWSTSISTSELKESDLVAFWVFEGGLLYLAELIDEAIMHFEKAIKKFKQNESAVFEFQYHLTRINWESLNNVTSRVTLPLKAIFKLEDEHIEGLKWDYVLLIVKITLNDYNWTQAYDLLEELERCNEIIPSGYDELILLMTDVYIANHKYSKATRTLEIVREDIGVEEKRLIRQAQILIESQSEFIEGKRLLTLAKEKPKGVTPFVEHLIKSRTDDTNALLFVAIYELIDDSSTDLAKVKDLLDKIKKKELEPNHSTKGPDKYPEIGIHLLEGEIHLYEQNVGQAAEAFSQVGRYYKWAGNKEQATIYFDQVLELDEKHTITRWYYADLLLSRSFTKEPPYCDEYILEEAYENWYGGELQAIAKSADYWVYSTASIIHEYRFLFALENAREEYWQALLYSERAAVWHSQQAYPLVHLAKNFCQLGLMKNGLMITNQYAPESTDLYVNEQMAMVYLNNYRWDLAQPLLDQLEEINTSNSYENWRGYQTFRQGELEKALEFFNTYIEKYPQDMWAIEMKLHCCFRMGQWKEAQTVARQILERQDQAGYHKDFSSFAWAHIVLGEFKSALDVEKDAARTYGDTTPPSLNEAIVLLVNRNYEAAQKHFKVFLKLTKDRNLAESITYSKDVLEQFVKALDELYSIEGEFRTSIADVLKGWIKRFENTFKEIPQTDLSQWSTKEEAQQALLLEACLTEIDTELKLHRFEPKTTPWTALHAAKARLLGEAQHYQESLAIYGSLYGSPSFPEAHRALKSKGRAWYLERFQAQEYEESSALIKLLQDFPIGDIKAKLTDKFYRCFTLCRLGSVKEAADIFTLAIEQSWDYDPSFIVEELRRILSESKDSRLIGDLEELLKTIAPTTSKSVESLTSAFQEFKEEYWSAKLNSLSTSKFTSSEVADYPSTVPTKAATPTGLGKLDPIIEGIEVECHTEDDMNVFTGNITSKLKQKYKLSYGLKLPSIRFQYKWEIPYGTFRMFGNTQLLGSGQLEIANGNKEHELFEALCIIIDKHLTQFHSLEDTLQLLNNEEEALAGLLQNLLAEADAVMQFHLLLKTLLSEQIPIFPINRLLETFLICMQQDGASNDCLAEMRQQCLPAIADRIKGLRSLRLPRAIEQNLMECVIPNGKRKTLVIPKKTYRTIRKSLSTLIAKSGNNQDVFLLVSDPRYRGFVRKVVAKDWPEIPVVAVQELAQTNQQTYETA